MDLQNWMNTEFHPDCCWMQGKWYVDADGGHMEFIIMHSSCRRGWFNKPLA